MFRNYDLASASHRAELQIGIEIDYRKKGLSTKLIPLALEWAKKESPLEYIDLRVFDNNLPAIKIYESLGFERIGFKPDIFRIADIKLNQIEMQLKI